MAGADAGVVEHADHLEAAEHAERAVVDAAGGHRVDVRAHDHRRAVLGTGTDADDVADAVNGHAQAEFAHPAGHQVAAPPVLVGQRQAADPAALERADLAECLQAADQPVEVDSEVASFTLGHGGTLQAAKQMKPD